MANFNKVILMGRLTRDPEVKSIGDNNTVTKFGIVYNRRYKDKETAHFFDCEAFGRTAENIGKFFNKGRQILIEGSLKYDTWEDKNGEKRSKVIVEVNEFEFVDSQKSEEKQEAPPQKEINTNKRPW